jgi:hypothetical protein
VNAFAEAATEIAERGDYSALGDGSRISSWLG